MGGGCTELKISIVVFKDPFFIIHFCFLHVRFLHLDSGCTSVWGFVIVNAFEMWISRVGILGDSLHE